MNRSPRTGGSRRRAPGTLAIAAALLSLAARTPLFGQQAEDAFSLDAEESAKGPIVYTEIGPSGLIARAITTDTSCPDLRIDGRKKPMQVRAAPSPPDFPVLVCEASIPSHTGSASIGRQRLPLLDSRPERILVIGDAGCRIRATSSQACNDPVQWPFAKIAARAARFRPDLVIHVGDYVYREEPCPPGNTGCAGSPHGENWDTLRADLFDPAAPLLAAAPWVFLRGNHESCSRNGEAWFRFLEPRERPAKCQDYTDPYKIDLRNLDLLVMDSSFANDFAIPDDQVAAYRVQFDAVKKMVTGESWLLTHKPVYVFGHLSVENGVEKLFIDQEVLQAASDNSFPPDLNLFIGGHVHLFETLDFGSGRPPQMTVGNSGTELDPPITTPLPGLEMAGKKVQSGLALDEFGFVVFDRRDGWKSKAKWDATLRGVRGETLLECTLDSDSLDCGRPRR